VAVCERLLAVQGQDPRGFRLAVRARTEGLAAADVDRALDDRELVVAWLNRGTLHLVRSEDLPWLHALTAPRLETAALRRLGQEGVGDPDAAVRAIQRVLADEGPLGRDAIAERTGMEGQSVYHALFLASVRVGLVRGPVDGARHLYVLTRDWLGEQPPVDRDAALAELARRYLAGHGPATDRDLARWAGVALRDARAGLGAIAAELVEEEGGLIDLAKRPAAGAPPAPPRLLGSFDPVLLGWTSRDDLVGPHASRIVSGGIFRPFAIVGGRVVATWGLRGGEVELEPLEPIDGRDSDALGAQAADVRRFLGL
jgi:hypothetical protein